MSNLNNNLKNHFNNLEISILLKNKKCKFLKYNNN